eukprot:Phypoly_transcript_01970.p1 GENE.Phypoly_transcript_01970~~Phypoly_transcript_01970.p1  ORF type:complete len:954 (+),score=99.16 Phypoly_transcript_01970:90-2951(+)
MILHANRDIAKVHQGLLEAAVVQLFSSKDVIINARSDGNIRLPANRNLLELDIWIPKLHLAFEFQDDYHYITAWYSHTSLVQIIKTDNIKVEAVRARGDTLILVPCWWDGTVESLFSTVCFYRPDLALTGRIAKNATVIAMNPPAGFFTGRTIPGVPELMLATFPKSPLIDFSSTFWWMGEKYDGMRFCWNADTEGIYTRTGLELNLQDSFYNHMPSTFLDGELWFGRGFFMLSQQLLNIEPDTSSNWPILRMAAFDMPSIHENALPFEERYGLLLVIPYEHPFIQPAMRVKCLGKRQMITALKRILRDGGEGLILRKPKSVYEHGRSKNLIKMKAARGDMEALVMSEGDNFYVLKLLDGKSIRVPKPKWTSPKLKKGDIVTVEYLSFSKTSTPVSPSIVRIRKDVIWEDAVREYAREGLASAARSITFKTKIKRRLFFENYARRAGFHPYVAANWYNVSRSSILETTGGNTLLQHYNNSMVNALITLFPEIEFKRSKFSIMQQNHWQNMANRREFMREVANKRGFDPLVAENWYTLTKENIMHFKGVLSILKFHNGSLANALLSLFPEIGLEEHKFTTSGAANLDSIPARRNFLSDFARQNEFDPLSAKDWYSFAGDIVATENARSLLSYYSGDIVAMLMHVFPDVGLVRQKLETSYANYWRSTIDQFSRENEFDALVPANWYKYVQSKFISVRKQGKNTVLHYPRDMFITFLCATFPNLEKDKFIVSTDDYNIENNRKRSFFERYAKVKQFDPRIPDNWYSVKKEDFAAAKGVTSILAQYKGSIFAALLNLFPDVNWQVNKFQHLPKTFWSEVKNRKIFFTHFAAEKGFDPTRGKNWLAVRQKDILAMRGGQRILSFHDGSLAKALADLFPDVEFHSAYYKEPKNCRAFFADFATLHGFEPLVPDHWYKIKHRDILVAPGGTSVLSHYGGSHKSALMRVFPELTWKSALFI